MKESEPDNKGGNMSLLNQALIDELKKMECIQTPRVEAAFRAVLRHQFLPDAPVEAVYSNQVVLTKQAEDG
ncbi:MAG TPA: hypothetical protein VK206_21570, partial [Anaerolineales bacterium]|nr:hypothetical protein [Anaerolineales bacterium]